MVRKDKRKEHFLDKIPNIQFYTVNITEYYSGKYKKNANQLYNACFS